MKKSIVAIAVVIVIFLVLRYISLLPAPAYVPLYVPSVIDKKWTPPPIPEQDCTAPACGEGGSGA